MVKLKGQFVVEKRNDLNEMRAIGWTSQELRYLSFYLSKINAREPETRKVKVSLTEFANKMGVMEYDLRNIRPARDSLMQKIAIVPYKDGEMAFQLFKTCKIYSENGIWYIEFEAHDEALPLMFEFKEKYITYEVANVLQLQGTNHIRMYEILKQYEKLSETIISLVELRKRLGIKPDEYAGARGWVNFKLWVIDKCQKALAEKTDIKFTYEPIRQGRKIGAVKFFIEKNQISYQITFDEYEDEPDVSADETVAIINPSPEAPSEHVYENATLEYAADACDGEFDNAQMLELYGLAAQTLPPIEDMRGAVYKYLDRMYRKLGVAVEQHVKDGDPIKNRYAYFRGMLETNLTKGAAN